MAQPQSQGPPRAFSPPQLSPSPAPPQAAYALPPNKRPRADGIPPQPASPYASSPYAASPGAVGTPPATTGSPRYSQTPPVAGAYTPPPAPPPPAAVTNGARANGLNLPDARAGATPPMQTPQNAPVQVSAPTAQGPPQGQAQYTTATMAPIHYPAASPTNSPVPTPAPAPTPAANVMGPPQRPAERPAKDYEYDVTDSLAGTGIDLRAEEQYMSDLYSHALDAGSDSRTGFPQHPPGPKSTFYGAGPANQAAESTNGMDQDEFAAKAAERAWSESSMRLAVQRTQEINDPFLLVALLHQRAEKAAREHHLGLNLDMKNNNQTMGKMRLPEQFPTPAVNVRTEQGPDGTTVATTGSYIPQDSFLVDQLALMSIATKQRLRDLVEEASVIAVHRQQTSHGDVPEEWAAAAAPLNMEPLEPMQLDEAAGATDGGTNPLKRSAEAAATEDGAVGASKKLPKIGGSSVTVPMRERARQEREWEEARLRRRQRRKEGGTESGSTASRAGSVSAGTAGSVAPEPEKGMTKKEMKKNQALKAAEANSHANQNMTSSMFAGLGGKGSLFGKKKTGKTYDWMNVGRTGGGTNSPARATPGPKGINGSGGASAAAHHALTTEGRNRLGAWREDKEKGKSIQLRDWVMVLERDGREQNALSAAYVQLDTSNPR
ncbi:hypothetical protein RJ55_00224 [Drechmeria coniospora]|nr:hypothetical protein RJ55_00224 [Drechmeria coniospora]